MDFFPTSIRPVGTISSRLPLPAPALRAAGLLCALSLAACGGGGGGGTGAVTGVVAKGPVGGATVTLRNASTGAALATAPTAADGSFTLPTSFSGDAIVEATGGSYTDEATGTSTGLAATLRAVVTLQAGTATAVLTPLTTLAYTYAFGTSNGGITTAAFNSKAAALAGQLQLTGVDLAGTLPVVAGSSPNSYGMALRAVSQYLKNTGDSVDTFTGTRFTAAQWQMFSNSYTDAYDTANNSPGTFFVFTGAGLAADAVGTCGVNVTGTVVARGFTLPLNRDFCVGITQPVTCMSTAGQTMLRALVNNQGGVFNTPGLAYAVTPQCVAGATAL